MKDLKPLFKRLVHVYGVLNNVFLIALILN